MMAPRPHKYGARRTTVDGIAFDSKAEARRYGILKVLADAGKIADLELQPAFRCEVNGRHICSYRADFRYRQGGEVIIEDVKGATPRDFTMRKNLVEALHGVSITVIPA